MDGALLEMGGQWIAPSHERMHQLVAHHGLRLVDPTEGAITLRVGGAARQVPTRNELDENLSPFEMADLGQGLLRFRRLAERVARTCEDTGFLVLSGHGIAADWLLANAKVGASVSFGAQPVWMKSAVMKPHAMKAPTLGITIAVRNPPNAWMRARRLVPASAGRAPSIG